MKFLAKKNRDLNNMKELDTVYLVYYHYDDYGYCTNFTAYYYDGELVTLGELKIGYKNLRENTEPKTSQNGYASFSVYEKMPSGYFTQLPDSFFSLGLDVGYYKKIKKVIKGENNFFENVRDLAYNFPVFEELYAKREPSLMNSLMRTLYVANVEQFSRIIRGEAELTPYDINFLYKKEAITIKVIPNSLPPSNIHVLIGRNGVGKTWLLYNMMHSILKNMGLELEEVSYNAELDTNSKRQKKYKADLEFELGNVPDTFAGAIGMSFSAFDDTFSSIYFQGDVMEGEKCEKMENDFNKKYKYIGLINRGHGKEKTQIKTIDDLFREFEKAIENIKNDGEKSQSFLIMCRDLEADPMLNDNGFIELLNDFVNSRKTIGEVEKNYKKLSSGHMIIVLSLTLLCESIYEKTVVLIDEPETHLHPPLLSTYIRTLSNLLRIKNAVAIIATHSPIVVQEIPASCVTKIERNKENVYYSRPSIETFATNTDSLTREIFGYEVIKTGFYKLIEEEIEDDFATTFDKFDGQIGTLGQFMIQRLMMKRSVIENEED